MGEAKRKLSRLASIPGKGAGDGAATATPPTPILDRPRCIECYFFEPTENGQGFCHGSRPTPIPVPQQSKHPLTGEVSMQLSIQRVFTPVIDTDWCGDWEPLAEEDTAPEALLLTEEAKPKA